jgi:hypothetical protein
MTITAFSGPIFQYGITLSSTSGDGITGQDYEHNEQRAPMMTDLGDSLMDPRSAYDYKPGSGVTVQTVAFYNNQATVDYVPTSVNTSGFMASSIGSSGVTTFAIPSSISGSSNGIITTTIVAPETGKVTGTLLAIDSTAAFLTLGSAGTAQLWNPGFGTGRCIQIITSSSGDAGTFSIAGRDMYGYKMTETLALSQGTTNSSGYTILGQKAFKYISAITNTTTPASTGVSIGFTDRYGFPWIAPYAGLNAEAILIATANGSSAAALLLSSNNFILPSSAATQTSTTPDVRGIMKSTTASNGTIRLQMIVTPAASAIAAITSTNVAPLFGPTQFSSV